MKRHSLTSSLNGFPHRVAVCSSGVGVWIGADPGIEPEIGAWLTPGDARKVARWLRKAAERAESKDQ